jgi:hypothetical protein
MKQSSLKAMFCNVCDFRRAFGMSKQYKRYQHHQLHWRRRNKPNVAAPPIFLKLLHFPLQSSSHSLDTNVCGDSPLPSDKQERELKGNATVGKEGKPPVPSSPPSMGLISVVLVYMEDLYPIVTQKEPSHRHLENRISKQFLSE